MRQWLVVATLALAGCRPGVKTGGGPYADKVAEDVPKIEQALGVKFKTPPRIEIRSRDEVRDFLLRKVREPAAAKDIANEEITYTLLGMLPDTMHLSDFFVRVLTEQILGYYDPKTKVLYIVQGAPDDYVGITIMHELVHALQDQYANLDSLEALSGDDDRAAAIQAVIEGQAMYEQMYIMAGGSGNLAAQLPGGWESIRSSIRENMQNQPVFSSAPMVIREGLLFPYINGADFVRRFKAQRPGRLPLNELPVSTTQIMHDSAYFGAKPELPVSITLPSIPGTVEQNDFGEFGTRLFIFQHTKDQDESIRAAGGWAGDRYALVKTASGYALAWVTVWNTPGDAAEFMAALDDVMQHRYFVKPAITGEQRHFETRTRTVDVDVRDIGGKPAVLYVDVPAGSSTHIIDFSQVTVAPQ
ncbi:MAG TPA: hypothetical protein VHV78_04940 [Gemmatimonadaceae bacterium]|nr:hypothetical protein [Gemmatimonadaceae bacterium]